ncbi:MAG TPA: hypothetical protein VG096_10160 [Bryobacteraceae bacterium]|nr:hypothetical protein [Bryobacteraceae bacterium]
MADFRRWIIALAVLALFAGLASAQTGGTGGPNFTCSANTSNIPTLRQEGFTEQIGDIVITCVGGNATDGALAPQVNITVALAANTQITTRLVNTSNVSEALLLIDEPTTAGGSGPVAGFGNNAGFIACPNPTTGGCQATGYHVAGAGGAIFTVQTGTPTSYNTGPSPAPAAGGTQAANIFQGVVNNNQVTFFGIPIVAPGSNGQRVYRITNIRMNATGIANAQSVSAVVSTSNPSALPISQGNPIVGFVTTSLKATVAAGAGFAQCVSQTLAPAGILSFQEANNFGSAFKVRTDPAVVGQTATPGPTKGQGAVLAQNVPGTIYNSESGFTPSTPTFGTITGLIGSTIGLADFGTRFHAVFTNLPPGAKIYVSTISVGVTLGAVTGPSATTAGTSYALLVSSATSAEGSTVASTTTAALGVPVVEIDALPTSTTAEAVWEVIQTSPTTVDTYNFAVYISYTAAPGSNLPAIGTSSVALNYAPTSAQSTTLIPRFAPDPPPTTAFTIAACQTVLLFPYLTNLAGFDTGVAISNTSTDPFGTTPQSGTCSLNWYGIAAPAVTVTPAIGLSLSTPVAMYANTVSTLAPGFQGYMIAQCKFQYAHGFAFVSDVGARNLAMGYLALVIPDPSLNVKGARPPQPFPCTSSGGFCQGTGEQLGE